MRRLLAIALLVFAAQAQDSGPGGPLSLFEMFMELGAKAAKGDEKALTAAAALFDVTDVGRANQARSARRAAEDLYAFLNRVGLPDKIPVIETTSVWIYSVQGVGEIECFQRKDGRWRFSAKTRDEISELLHKVRDAKPRFGKDIATSETWLRDLVPAWLQRKVVLLAHWQWVGLLMLIVLGVIAAYISSFVFFRAARRLARARGTELRRGRKAGRPFGLVAMAALWWLGLDWLLLPERVHIIFILAARFLLMAGVVWSLLRVVDWISEVFIGLSERTSSKFDDLLVPMVRRAVKVFVVALGVVWIADNLDMDVGALLAGLGIGGVALALAAKDTVANFFGALTVLADRPFEVGDWIIIGGIEGTVAEVGFRSTRVRTFYDSLITFPNSIVITTPVDNLGRRKYRRFKATIGVTYDTPADKLEAFLEGIRELIRTHPYTRRDYYHVYLHGFGDNALNIMLYMFFDAPDWATELRERQRLLMDVLRLAQKLGVEFAFPTRTVHLVQGEVPQHGAPTDVRGAWQTGQAAARGIVEEFTGQPRPRPVQMGQRPDEALDGSSGES